MSVKGLHYGLKPVPGAGLEAFDRRRIRDYFKRVRSGTLPADDDSAGWERLLRNTRLMTPSAGHHAATIDGILLFGETPDRYLPQSEGYGMGVSRKMIPGMRAHNGTEPDLIAEPHRLTVRLWKHGSYSTGSGG